MSMGEYSGGCRPISKEKRWRREGMVRGGGCEGWARAWWISPEDSSCMDLVSTGRSMSINDDHDDVPTVSGFLLKPTLGIIGRF